jgi:hypothetical protein
MESNKTEVKFKVYPHKILLSHSKKEQIFYEIYSSLSDRGSIIVFNPEFADCFKIDNKDNLISIKKNSKIKGRIFLDFTGKKTKRIVRAQLQLRLIKSHVFSDTKNLTIYIV